MAKLKISASRQRMIRSGIAYLRFKGYHEIKAYVEDFKDPQSVYNQDTETAFQPDVVAQRNFGTFIFDIIEDTDLESWQTCEEKWKTFEAYALRKKGKLGLIVYSDYADTLKERLLETELDPSIIQIRK